MQTQAYIMQLLSSERETILYEMVLWNPGPNVTKHFSYPTQPNIIFQLLIKYYIILKKNIFLL